MLCILGSYTLSSSYTVFVSSSFACWSFAYPALRCRIFSLWSFFFLWYAKSSAVFSVVFPAIQLLQRISFISYINFYIFNTFWWERTSISSLSYPLQRRQRANNEQNENVFWIKAFAKSEQVQFFRYQCVWTKWGRSLFSFSLFFSSILVNKTWNNIMALNSWNL